MAESDQNVDGQPGDGGATSISQSEIDALMQGVAPSTTVAAPSPVTMNDISQADIDALMNSASGSSASSAEPGATSAPVDARVDTLGRPFDEAAAAMQAAMEEERAARVTQAEAASQASVGAPPEVRSFEFPDLSVSNHAGADPARVSMLGDVNLNVRIELGRTRMLVEDVLKLDEGSVVELDKLAGDPVDVYVNDRLVAHGEVLVLNDNFCVRVGDVFSHDPHRVLK